jgi:deazaflavin-dependent oxidoreductase (nitroreductase family)
MGDAVESLAVKAAMKTPPRRLIPWITRVNVVVYKLSNGRLGSTLAGKPGILVRTIGAKSGQRHTVCLPFVRDGGDRILVASYGGGPTNPAWYYNLKANPDVVVRDKASVVWCHAEVVGADEREALWPKVVADSPWYGEYQSRTTRTIPLIRLRETGPFAG